MLTGIIILGVLAVLSVTGLMDGALRKVYLKDFTFIVFAVAALTGAIIAPVAITSNLVFSIGGAMLFLAALYVFFKGKNTVYYLVTFLASIAICFLFNFLIASQTLALGLTGVILSLFLGVCCMHDHSKAVSIAVMAVGLGIPLAQLLAVEGISFLTGEAFSVAVIASVAGYLFADAFAFIGSLGKKRKQAVDFETTSIENSDNDDNSSAL